MGRRWIQKLKVIPILILTSQFKNYTSNSSKLFVSDFIENILSYALVFYSNFNVKI